MSPEDTEKAIRDIHEICSKNGIPYVVIGSAAAVAAVGRPYRAPYDVDFLYAAENEQTFSEELRARGYREVPQTNRFSRIFPPSYFRRYQKDSIILEPRTATFRSDGSCEIPVALPSFESKVKISGRIVLGKRLIAPHPYRLGVSHFMGLPPESLYLILRASRASVKLATENSQKLDIDILALEPLVSADSLREILSETPRSGIYLGQLPLITLRNLSLLKLLATLSQN